MAEVFILVRRRNHSQTLPITCPTSTSHSLYTPNITYPTQVLHTPQARYTPLTGPINTSQLMHTSQALCTTYTPLTDRTYTSHHFYNIHRFYTHIIQLAPHRLYRHLENNVYVNASHNLNIPHRLTNTPYIPYMPTNTSYNLRTPQRS